MLQNAYTKAAFGFDQMPLFIFNVAHKIVIIVQVVEHKQLDQLLYFSNVLIFNG